MIRRDWKPPTIRVTAVYRRGAAKSWLTRGDSPEAVRERLTKKGWTVQKTEQFDYGEWERDADALAAKLVRAFEQGEQITFKESKWQEMKEHLFELFDNKCAYCESKPRTVEPGDVEHFRPKRQVTEDVGHPGYYWLAYDVSNLLPSCNECNRARGKWNQFPVEEGTRARTVSELNAEKSLLLHPYHDTPRKHLNFTRSGDVVGRTTRGKKSVEVYGLDRPELIEARFAALKTLERDMDAELLRCEIGRGATWELVSMARVQRLQGGHDEYSAALLRHMVRIAASFAKKKVREADRARRTEEWISRTIEA